VIHLSACDRPPQSSDGFTERVPGFDTILKVVKALGLKLHAEPTEG
jgi:hypothetical protein